MTDCPFLKIPLEVRIQIYRLLLHNGKPVCVEPGSEYNTSKVCKLDPGYGSKRSIYSSPPGKARKELRTYMIRPQGVQIGIVSVNRQTYLEASVIFYS